jgi:TRAP-type C4-dicarboxylate transport system substrate-binding protein
MRVQATVTEDTTFPAYGAQVVHMPFGEVYTSLQTGVCDMAENGINNYLINKHYEVAPVLSITEHEANNAALFVSDKVWSSLSDEQKNGYRRRPMRSAKMTRPRHSSSSIRHWQSSSR